MLRRGLDLLSQVSRFHERTANQVVAFNFGNFIFVNYGVFASIGVLASTALFYVRAFEFNVEPYQINHIILGTMFCNVIGSRTLFLMSDFKLMIQNPINAIRTIGFSFYGGFIFGIVFLFIFTRIYQISFFLILDIIALALPLGYAIGRVGCLTYGCCHGKETNTKLGVVINNAQSKAVRVSNIKIGTSLFPTQTLSMFLSLAIFLLLNILAQNPLIRTGYITSLYLVWYGLTRFLLEFVRYQSFLIRKLSLAQWFSMFFFLLGIALMIHVLKTQANPTLLHLCQRENLIWFTRAFRSLITNGHMIVLTSLAVFLALSMHYKEIGRW